MIRITNVVKYRGSARVLNEATLVAEPGHLTALVGPSGGGKSTLLRCVNGLETFQAGTIEAFGQTLQGGSATPQGTLRKLRQSVGMVFQQFHLFPHMNALQNIMCGPIQVLGHNKAQAAEVAKRLLARVGLAEKADAKPGNLNGGQQQRVAIARALAVNPAAILFDEPTSSLDPHMVGEVLAVLRDLAADGQTMIVVTHDSALARYATLVHQMEAGRVTKCGPPEQFFSEPDNAVGPVRVP
jgi:ABC-type polar amino acid transport system ATPase subunit